MCRTLTIGSLTFGESVGQSTEWFRSAPDLVSDFNHEVQLRPLFVYGENVAFLRAGEAALRTQAELVERHIGLRIADPPPDVVLALETARLCRHQAEHNLLLAFWNEAQRLEATGAVAVIFEKIAVIVAEVEQHVRRLRAGGRYGS